MGGGIVNVNRIVSGDLADKGTPAEKGVSGPYRYIREGYSRWKT